MRRRLGLTQGELARRLGTRQQTVSQWETGASRPRGMSRRLLRLVAEQGGYYRVERADGEPERSVAGGERAEPADPAERAAREAGERGATGERDRR